MDKTKTGTDEPRVIWTDKKRYLGLPISFTRYTLTEESILIKTGFLTIKEEEVRLFRVRDMSKVQTLWQRIFGVGTISLESSDKTKPSLEIISVRSHDKVKGAISRMVDLERVAKGVRTGEYDGANCDGEQGLYM